jgi:hypothetical protein
MRINLQEKTTVMKIEWIFNYLRSDVEQASLLEALLKAFEIPLEVNMNLKYLENSEIGTFLDWKLNGKKIGSTRLLDEFDEPDEIE